MSEEQQTSTIDASVVPPAIETTEPTESAESTPASATNGAVIKPTEGRPAGYEPVDVKTATPEQVQERIDYLYRQVKPKERENREMRQLLEQQSRVIAELSQSQQQVVTHLTQKSFADGKEQLKSAMQEAWKKGDNNSYIEAQNKLMDLQVEERVASRMQPQPQQQTNGAMPNNAAEIANRAMQSGELSADEYRVTESWQNEKDDSGNTLRPWAFSTDPTHMSALFEARSVMANPRYVNWSHAEKLAEVDRRMGLQKRTTSQTVMGANLTKPIKSNKVDLSPKQRDIALRTQYAGKGKSEADHLEAYRKQVEKFTQTRRVK